jgi:putative oxidoreductase
MASLFERGALAIEALKSKLKFEDFILLWARLEVAKIFYASGRTKAESAWGEGYLTINDFQGVLFEEEYGITFVDPELMATLALYGETFLPIMLLVGFGARIGALGLFGMTLFIQIFVYPTHFMEHALWASILAVVMFFGAGKISLDNVISKKLATRNNR